MEKDCKNCIYYKSKKYHDLMWCRDCNSNKNHFKAAKTCFCGAKYNGIECNSCGFDASECDIY